MMEEKIRIAIAQINPVVGDLEYNRDRVKDYIGRAKKSKADMVIFPELAVCGYPPEDLLLKPHFVKDNISALHSLRSSARGITAVVGFADMCGRGNVYNAAAVVDDGAVKGVYRKIELPNYGVFDEKRYFTPGNRSLVFSLGGRSFGLNICEDMWVDKGPFNAQVKAGACALLDLSASPYYKGKWRERLKLLADRARRTGAYICYANLVGGQDELVFDGRSFILDPSGYMIACGREFEEDLVVADLGIKRSRKKTSRIVKGVKKISLSRKIIPKKSFIIEPLVCEKMGRLEEVYSALVLGTKDYIMKNGFTKAVLGLSGGVDSALVAAIACEALGRKNVVAVSMPSRYSSSGTKKDAKRLARNLGIKIMEMPIDGILNTYLRLLGKVFPGKKHGLAEENLQARIRGNILMALANKFGWLVLATGNKSETAVGYCTLYGDMAGGYSAIKDVPKTLVYELAEMVNSKSGREIIPESVIKRAPSAELAPGQKDTDSLPAYKVLDPVLEAYIEKDLSFDRIKAEGVKAPLLKRIVNMVDKSEYKRRQSCPGVKITPKAFGKDRRLPVTNRYRERGR